MKILVFNWRDINHPWAGGAEVNLHQQARRWVAWGHRVTLVCSGYPGATTEEEIDGIRVLHRAGRYLTYPAVAVEYLRRLRHDDYDVLLDVVNGIPFFTPLFSRRPRVALFHHLVKGIFFRELPPHLAAVGYLVEKSLPWLYRGTPVVAVSESTKQELVEAGFRDDRVTVIPNGVELPFSENGFRRSQFPHILYLGRLRHYKRLDLLLHAMKLVVEAVPAARLTIAGTGESQTQLQGLAASLGLDGTVDFRGFVAEEEKEALFRTAWVMVTPSQKEGWGLAVTEAAARGLPTVAFDVPGLRDSVVDGTTGLLVKEISPPSLAGAIRRCLQDHGLRSTLGAAAASWGQSFSWEESAGRFLALLEQVARRRA